MVFIHGSILSPYVRKVLLTLEFKRIPYQCQPCNPFAEADKQKLLQLSPLGKVPILQEDDFVLADSSVICAYLEKQYSTEPVYPSEARFYAQSLWYEEYIDSQLTSHVATAFLHSFVGPKLLNRQPDAAALAYALEIGLPTAFSYLDENIQQKNYLVGNRLSIADISLLAALTHYTELQPQIDKNRWPHLIGYLEKLEKLTCLDKIVLRSREKFKELFPSG